MLREVKHAVTSTLPLEPLAKKKLRNAACNQCFRETGMQQDGKHVPGRKWRETLEGILPRGAVMSWTYISCKLGTRQWL